MPTLYRETLTNRLSRSKRTVDDAIGEFAVGYADQAERDHAALKAAVRKVRSRVLEMAESYGSSRGEKVTASAK